jgi:hypothetical protein
VSYAQRLGYLLELVGEKELAEPLADYVHLKRPIPTALTPRVSIKGTKKDRRWQIYVNSEVEPDI